MSVLLTLTTSLHQRSRSAAATTPPSCLSRSPGRSLPRLQSQVDSLFIVADDSVRHGSGRLLHHAALWMKMSAATVRNGGERRWSHDSRLRRPWRVTSSRKVSRSREPLWTAVVDAGLRSARANRWPLTKRATSSPLARSSALRSTSVCCGRCLRWRQRRSSEPARRHAQQAWTTAGATRCDQLPELVVVAEKDDLVGRRDVLVGAITGGPDHRPGPRSCCRGARPSPRGGGSGCSGGAGYGKEGWPISLDRAGARTGCSSPRKDERGGEENSRPGRSPFLTATACVSCLRAQRAARRAALSSTEASRCRPAGPRRVGRKG